MMGLPHVFKDVMVNWGGGGLCNFGLNFGGDEQLLQNFCEYTEM